MYNKEVKNLQRLKSIVHLVGHICMFLQIAILLLIFVSALYLIFTIMDISVLDSLTPFMNSVGSFITSIFGNAIKVSKDGIDGRIVIFIMLCMLLAFFVVQLKMACNTYSKTLDKQIVYARSKEEKEFNQKLEEDVHKGLVRQHNYLLAIQIRVKSLFKESLTAETHSAEVIYKYKMEALKNFLSQLKTLNGINVSQDGDIILINSDDINNIDRIVSAIWKISDQIKADLRTHKIGFRARLAVDAYSSYKSLEWVYKQIRPLLGLNTNNEVLCFGNFRNRYELIENHQHMIIVKGQYKLNSDNDETIWSLVKKD